MVNNFTLQEITSKHSGGDQSMESEKLLFRAAPFDFDVTPLGDPLNWELIQYGNVISTYSPIYAALLVDQDLQIVPGKVM